MADSGITKGSRVEVSSDDAGFQDAWYVATVVDVVAPPPEKKGFSSKNKNIKKKKISGYVVKYDTLFEEDNLSVPLTETVDASFVRPLSPAVYGGGGGCEFKVNDVVDAYHMEGWWTGAVTKVTGDGETRRYTVSFQNPPEVFEFEKRALRLHSDWIDGQWRLPLKKAAKSGSDAQVHFATPSKGGLTTDRSVNQTIGLRSYTKNKNLLRKKATYSTVGLCSYAKKKNLSRKKATSKSGPSKGDLKTECSVNRTISLRSYAKNKNLSRKKATSKPAENENRSRKKAKTDTKTVDTVNGSHTVSRNNGVMRSVEENSSTKQFKPSTVCMENTEDQDSFVLELETISTTKRKRGRPPKTPPKGKRGRPPKTPVKEPNGLLQGNEEAAGKSDSSAIDEMQNELDEQPLSVWYQGLNHPLPVSNKPRLSRCINLEPSVVSNPPVVKNGENHRELPFIKSSPIWAIIETLQLYRDPPQNPHFSPLKEVKEDCREGLAVGHMVTFANVVERTSRLQPTDPTDIITNSLETLNDLESHGFNVGAVRARLNGLMARKVQLEWLADESKEVKTELMKANLEKLKVEDEITEVVGKMKELQEKLAEAVISKNVKHEEIGRLRAKLRAVYDRIADGKVEFEKLAATPL